MKTGILWDLDGTLLNTLDDLYDSVNHTLAAFGYPLRTKEEVRRFVGNGAKRLIALSVPDGAAVAPVLEYFQNYYKDHAQIKTRPYPGVLEALAELQENYPIAIVSNKPDGAVKMLCDQYFPGVYAQGELENVSRKPAPDSVYKAMEAIGVESCIYVGDSEVDVLTAKNAGVPCLCVLWGFRDRECLQENGGVHFCENPDQLVACINEVMKDGK